MKTKLIIVFCLLTFFVSVLYAMGEPAKVPIMKTQNNVELSKEISNLTIEMIVDNNKKVHLSWVNPSYPGFEGLIIVVRTDRYPENPNDGKQLIDLLAKPASKDSHVHSYYYGEGIKAIYKDPNQYYCIFTYDKKGNYSKGVRGVLHGMIL